ncbi:MAG: hypothetical protein WCY30_01690 [Candidatus Neomarinimicrobiota bacterium]|jgi:hypothetical protein
MDTSVLRTFKSLSIVHLWLFIFLRSLCDKNGNVKQNYTAIQNLIRGARIGENTGLDLTIQQIREKLGELAYLGIIRSKEGEIFDDTKRYVAPLYPIRLSKEYLVITPNDPGAFNQEELYLLKEREKNRDEHIKHLNATIKKLREENKLIKAGNPQEFKTVKKDGTVDQRGMEFQRLWAWFTILGIQQAFQKIVSDSEPEEYKMMPDYRIMAVWLSVYGLEMIEALLLKMYMNNKANEIKSTAGTDWPNSIIRYIYGSLKGMKEKQPRSGKEDNNETWRKRYVPAGGWKDND